jgi:outer membrane protein TolC
MNPVLLALATLPAAQVASQDPTPPARVELSLLDAARTALENDLSLKLEENNAEVSQYTYEGSWGSFDPVFRADASYADVENRNNNPFFTIDSIKSQTMEIGSGLNLPLLTGGAVDLSFQQSNTDSNFALFQRSVSERVALSFNQPLLRAGGSAYATSTQRENELRMRRQLERVRQARQDLIQRVAQSYWDLVTALEQARVAEETLALGREQLTQNQRRLSAGVGTEVEVLQAETNVAQRVEQKLAREVSVKAAADKLKGLMYPGTNAATWEREFVPVTQLPAVDPQSVPSWNAAFSVALAERSELRQQMFQIDEAEEQLLRASSLRRSQLDFTFETSSFAIERNEGDALESAFDWDYPTYRAGLSFSAPIGNRSALFAEKSARAGVRNARLIYDQLESQVVEEVRTAVRNTLYSIEAVRAAAASTELARRQLAAEQARYREGLSTNFQVLQFQQQLAETLYSQTLAHANLAKALIALRRSQGILDPERFGL